MRNIIALGVLFLLASCSAVGIDAKTPKQKLVVLEYSYQAALKTVDELMVNGIIKQADAATVFAMVKQSGDAVKKARLAVKLGDSDVAAAVRFANSLVIQLVTYLETKKGAQTSWATLYSLSKLSLQSSRPSETPASQSPGSKWFWIKLSPRAGTLRTLNLRPSPLRLISLRARS